ncbi:DUF2786 domain-containing protein [Paracoccus sp. (in: a-proteobacteria)]|uniref:DUF7168 domain-containing protein n=1 Tax=Paracoccus sp. TaxID=267 RepID=UPI0026E110C4|nr:DUF2786 domain-containing protein [Paracoccus sp. (in: a-proteobacteria)]MDO5648843.1 DUF2786 domain-containing protein [Paracoccus sp. (in: a-proteobacteria)]
MDVKAKIAALMAMTTASGCTEAEAMAAAKKAAALMLEYGLTRQDIEIDDRTVRSKTKGKSVRDPLWGTVGYCTNTAPIFLSDRDSSSIQFIGRAPGPEIAAYLFAVLNGAIDRAIREFKLTPEYRRRRSNITRRQAVYDFTMAMCVRLAMRLKEQFGPIMSAGALTEAKNVLDTRFPDARTTQRRQKQTRFHGAAHAGWQAGNAVGLARGVGGADGHATHLEDLR